jgi:hypothetical protein
MRMIVLTVKACVLLAAAPAIVADSSKQQAGPITSQQTVTSTATVENVNKETREVTLKRPDGTKVTVKVPDTVRNLDQVKPGDTVNAKYTQSVAVSIRKSDEPPTATERQTLRRAPVGATPSGEQTVTTQISANVEKIDKDKREVTLMAPDGSTSVVKVPEDMKKFDTLKQGDQVVVTATESLALNVTPSSER